MDFSHINLTFLKDIDWTFYFDFSEFRTKIELFLSILRGIQ